MGKILVLDDQAVNQEFLTELLQYGGHNVLEASEGNAALVLVQAERPDFVIADVFAFAGSAGFSYRCAAVRLDYTRDPIRGCVTVRTRGCPSAENRPVWLEADLVNDTTAGAMASVRPPPGFSQLPIGLILACGRSNSSCCWPESLHWVPGTWTGDHLGPHKRQTSR